MKPLKIAVMGAGLIGRHHAERILSEPATKPSAGVAPSVAGRDFVERAGIPWYRNFSKMAAGDRPDGDVRLPAIGQQGLATLRVIEAIKTSARTEQTVRLSTSVPLPISRKSSK
ncbi:putative dehydrogenase [Pararhizobium capsulatum DSM 1112]|uniref:Dehydrogenase n=1 Tax=Pararhizobium capsulatum DSM 1112 TaxID=1121113 RepID=A0ABU0BTW2_9HYPH|nr:putative dehydrogenase [Pararhizobium capsulatum DSM 1112]